MRSSDLRLAGLRLPDLLLAADFAPAPATLRERAEIPDVYKWDLSRIFPDWASWQATCERFAETFTAYAAMQGTLAEGAHRVLAALRLDDELGQLAYRLWFFASLWHDQDHRDNEVGAHRQEVQILFARWRQSSAWFSPEMLTIPLETVRAWMAADPALAVYRFVLEELYRQQAHVLDERGERLLSLAGRLSSAPQDAYDALSTADLLPPTVRLADGTEVVLSYGQYRSLLESNPCQADRALAYRAYHGLYAANLNTYAALYDGVLQRDWFHAQARGYATTLDAALYGNDIPLSVVENLISATRAGVAPLARYHRLRKRVLGLETYRPYDTTLPLVRSERKYPYEEVVPWIVASVAPLGEAYQQALRDALRGGYVDVYENRGKRSGAYSAPVYGVHPYMLMNYNDTLDAAFTLAHELGHTMHTLLAHRTQPFAYAGYTIFVAEVPSTLNESLFLRTMLANTTDPRERVALLEHAIDGIVGTFYTQVLFADFELQAHRRVERGEPITADALGEIYAALLRDYHGDAIATEDLSRVTWARIPHFFGSPYYVFQYATCFASTAQLVGALTSGSDDERAVAVDRYLDLLRAGGSDHPMTLLARAGVDLREPDTVAAVVTRLDALVTQLEADLAAIGVG